MTTCLGKSCSFGLPRVPFVNCCQFMYLIVSLLVLRAGCRILLYQFLIIAYRFTLQALHDTPPLCLVLLLRMFWHININVSTRFDQIHKLFHKILSLNIILKSIKGHNSADKFGKIMCISHNMKHMYINA